MQQGISTDLNIGSISPCLKNERIEFACRYYSFTTKLPQKCLTLTEAKMILAAGIQIVTVYEDAPINSGYFSFTRGKQDGQHAYELASAIGQPIGSAIYFAVDYDASQTDTVGVIEQYFEGVKHGLSTEGEASSYNIGVYGSGLVCSHIKEATKKLAQYSWLAGAKGWAGYSAYPTPDIRQKTATSVLCKWPAANYEPNIATDTIGAFSSLAPHSNSTLS